MEIAVWLRSLGLEQYERAFRDNDIDAEVLPRLTGEDLKDLGVASVGHRRKLLDAVAALHSGLSGSTGDHPVMAEQVSPAPAATDPSSQPSAERRQLTVLFCDLVGSTELARHLDPEDYRDVLGAYHRACAEAISRFEGFIAKYMGDGVLAYFGYPQAHEDEASQAVRAGLALVEQVGSLALAGRLNPLQVRVGIATGLVVVGDLIGTGSAQEQAVVGETPNLAARLQALAPSGGIVIASSTRRLIGDEFEIEDFGAQTLKGFAEPVPAWRVLSDRTVESRFEARSASLTPLVGREHELNLLLDRWQQACDGEGQAVLLSGEPGIGKSRIARTLCERIELEQHIRRRYQCSPYHTHSTFRPFIEQLERAAGFQREDAPDLKLDKLETLLARGTERVGEAAPLIAAMLSIPADGRYPPLLNSPQKQKELTIEALVEQLVELAKRQSVLCLFEDLHWADPSTLEVLDRIIGRITSARVLLLVTYRPEFRPPWTGRSHLTLISLNRLARRQSAALVEKVTGGRALPGEVLEQIVAKTDGVPLFIEELTKTVLEAGFLEAEANRYVLTTPLPPLATPATLQDSLMARLDRLGVVKEVAQIGACIGREFGYELLATISPLREPELGAALEQLVASELVFQRGSPPEATYAFKHALVQDAAYGSLLRSKRQQLHARVARALEERWPETTDSQPEVLAHHCSEAGLAERAIAYWQMAGQRAAKQSSNLEAISHLRKALVLVERLPAEAERAERELAILTTLGPSLMATKGWDAPEVEATYARARRLARETERPADLFPALWGLWLVAHAGGHALAARELHRELLDLAQGQKDTTLLLQAHHAGWSTNCSDGDFNAAQCHVDRGLSLYRPGVHGQQALTYGGHDPGVCAYSLAALNQFILGYPEKACRYSDEAVRLAREVGHAPSLVHALWYRAELCQIRGEADGAAELASIVYALAVEKGMALYAAWAMMVQGWADTVRGRSREGIERAREGLAALRANGTKYHLPHRLGLLAQTYAAAGEIDAALAAIDETIASVEETGERWFEAEAHRLRAELLLAGTTLEEAEPCLEHAIEVAARQHARLWELRAAITIARSWIEVGAQAKARAVLMPVYDWFTEGLDTKDLLEAKALLDAPT